MYADGCTEGVRLQGFGWGGGHALNNTGDAQVMERSHTHRTL